MKKNFCALWRRVTIFRVSQGTESLGRPQGKRPAVRNNFATNSSQLGSLTAYEKMIVAEHELGHAYGLDENNNEGCVLMRQGEDPFTCGTMPTDNDIDGVEAIYQ